MSEGRAEQAYEDHVGDVGLQQDEGARQDSEEQMPVEARISGRSEGFVSSPSISESAEEAGDWASGQRQEVEEWD